MNIRASEYKQTHNDFFIVIRREEDREDICSKLTSMGILWANKTPLRSITISIPCRLNIYEKKTTWCKRIYCKDCHSMGDCSRVNLKELTLDELKSYGI